MIIQCCQSLGIHVLPDWVIDKRVIPSRLLFLHFTDQLGGSVEVDLRLHRLRTRSRNDHVSSTVPRPVGHPPSDRDDEGPLAEPCRGRGAYCTRCPGFAASPPRHVPFLWAAVGSRRPRGGVREIVGGIRCGGRFSHRMPVMPGTRPQPLQTPLQSKG